MGHIVNCPTCGKKPNRWLGEECELFLGHCGVTCEGVIRWNQYAAAMELAKASKEYDNSNLHKIMGAGARLNAAYERVLEVFNG